MAANPELPKLKLPETEREKMEMVLDMDEEIFRRVFNMPKVTGADLQRSGTQEENEMD